MPKPDKPTRVGADQTGQFSSAMIAVVSVVGLIAALMLLGL